MRHRAAGDSSLRTVYLWLTAAADFFLDASICLCGLGYRSMRLAEMRNRSLDEFESRLRNSQ